jgi:bacterial/archaeal transporter family protein
VTWLPWALLSALFAGATAILAKVGVEGVDSNLATAIRTTVVVVFAWTVAAATNQSIQAPAARTWLFLILSGLATGLSWLCYFRALQLGPASRVAPIDKLSVVFVIVFSAVLLGEKLTWGKAVGGVLIVAGVIVVALE